ncbi:MAG TPA: hypothetical protein VF202_01050 [Trueperaceae bacterium]
MAKRQSLTLTLHIQGARETLRAFGQLPKEANDALRARSLELAESLAVKARGAGVAEGRQARLVASTVQARRDRLPVIVAGGTKRLGRKRTPAFGLLFGSEFGMDSRSGWYAAPRYDNATGQQYKPHRGRDSYWFFKTADDNQAEISAAWNRAADDVLRAFGGA